MADCRFDNYCRESGELTADCEGAIILTERTYVQIAYDNWCAEVNRSKTPTVSYAQF